MTESTHAARSPSLREIYLAHGDYVWLTLQRMGIRDADIEDVAQEVYVVVHRRLALFDGSSKVRTWLFGICLRVVANHRRRAWVRRERPTAEPGNELLSTDRTAEEHVALQQARTRLEAILAQLTPVQRAVLVMFEVEELSCEAIALQLGIPVGTVHSRLHAARKSFAQALQPSTATASRSEP